LHQFFSMIAPSLRSVRDSMRARDLRLVSRLLVLAVLVWCFLGLATLAASTRGEGIDHAVLRALRTDAAGTDPVGPPWLESAFMNISALGSGAVATLVVIFVLGFLLLDRKPRLALLVAACGAGTALVIHFLKLAFERGRPSIVTALQPASGLSFPSGHAMISVALYLTLGVLIAGSLEHRRLRVYVVGGAALLAVLIGSSRVYLGVHYPTDVLAGWTVGLAWALLCGLVERALQRRGSVEEGEQR
jgi:undecaprenyl-diphosphatase